MNARLYNNDNAVCRILFRSCLLCFSLAYGYCHAQTAFLEPPQITQGDVSILVIELESKIPSLYGLDTTELEANFEILESQSRIISVHEQNEITRKMQWKVYLHPRKSGQLQIPSLLLGGNPTPALTLEVKPQPTLELQQVYIEMEAKPLDPYLQQQSRITMRLFHNTPLHEGQLHEPKSENTHTFRSGHDQTYSVIRNGQAFQVIERSVTVFANTTGKIDISAARFRGEIDQLSSGSDSSPPIRRIYRTSKPLELQVRDKPPAYSGEYWIPAGHIDISQSWGKDSSFSVGDSFNRTITILATGLPAKSLPADLLLTENNRFKVYPDQPERSNEFSGETLIGQLKQSFAVILSEPGETTIPGLTLTWWDTDQAVEKQIELPGKTIQVSELNSFGTNSAYSSETLINSNPEGQGSGTLSNAALIIAIFILAMLLSLLSRKQRDRINEYLILRFDPTGLKRELRQSCISNNPTITRRILLRWARKHWPQEPISGLHHISAKIRNTEFDTEMSQLDAAIFSNRDPSWQGLTLWRLIVSLNRQQKQQSDNNLLPPLYPLLQQKLRAFSY
jgi:hypothetical protein